MSLAVVLIRKESTGGRVEMTDVSLRQTDGCGRVWLIDLDLKMAGIEGGLSE